MFEQVLSPEEMERLRWDRTTADFSRLPETERSAIEMLRGEFELKASEYPAEFLRLKDRVSDSKFTNDAELAVKFLLKFLPDRPPQHYRSGMPPVSGCYRG